jgi:hypothetical protein
LEGISGFERLVPRAQVVVRRLQDATPEEVKEIAVSAACDSIEVMVNDQRFPTVQETVGFIASAAVEQGISAVTGELYGPAAALRGSLADALVNEAGLITQATLDEARTDLGC